MSAETILVTGATGFVGSHVVDRLLHAGARVRVTIRATSDLRWLEGKPIERVEADLRDRSSLARAVHGTRAILHFGGRIRGRRLDQFLADNAEPTAALAEAFVEQAPSDGSGLFLLCSSLAAGGPAPESDRRPVPHVIEEDHPGPVSPYGESKLAAEKLLGPLADRARIVIFRPPAVYGPRDEAILKFFKILERGWLLLPRPRGNLFSLINVHDLAEATLLAVSDRRARGLYYLSDGVVHTWQDVGQRVSELLGARARKVRVPMPLMVAAALFGEVGSLVTRRAPLVSFGKLRELRQRYWVCFPNKADREFGFQPRVDLATGLEETIRWYQKRGWLRAKR